MEDFPAHHVWKNQRVAVWPSRNPRCPHRLAALVTRNSGEVCCRWEGYTTVRLLGSPIPQGRSCNGQVPYIVTRESAHREKERERVHAQLWQDCSQPVGNWTSHMIELLRFWSFLFIHFFLRGKSSPFLFVRHVSIFCWNVNHRRTSQWRFLAPSRVPSRRWRHISTWYRATGEVFANLNHLFASICIHLHTSGKTFRPATCISPNSVCTLRAS